MDKGNGFSEEDSVFVQSVYDENNLLHLRFAFDSGIKKLRIDPEMQSCMLYDLEIWLNGKVIYELKDAEGVQCKNKCVESNGQFFGTGAWVFASVDPNFTIDMAGIKLEEHNVLRVDAKVEWLPLLAASALCRPENSGKKKRFFR